MEKRKRTLTKGCIILWWMIFSIIPSTPVFAAPLNNTDQVAVALVIDNSGSMKNSDPLNSRFAASRMVLELLSESDYLSISTFSDEAVNLLPLTELKGDAVEQAKDSLLRIPPADGYTDYQKALALAKNNLDALPDQGINKFIIFLTDGKPEVQDKAVDMALYEADLKSQVVTMAKAGHTIYTVGFGATDQALLESISSVTRGSSLQGESSTVAVSFFDILQELKNRYALIGESVSGQEKVVPLEVDEYTSRVTVLIHDEKGDGAVRITGKDGRDVQPVMQTQNLKVYHLYHGTDNQSMQYVLNGKWTGSLHAVRDTKTKLWINEPVKNSQIPFERDIKAKIIQTGFEGENTKLSAVLKQNGNPISRPLEVLSWESYYEVKIGRLPQTGTYELEVSLRNNNRLIAQTTSNFEVKNIPILVSNLKEDPVWIEGEDKKVTAFLQRSGKRATTNLNDVELLLHLQQGNRKSSITLLDDGSNHSGDLIPNDGIYSGMVKDLQAGTLSYVLSAQGDYFEEPFLLSTPLELTKAEKAGIVEVNLPQTVLREVDHPAEIELQLTNKGTYPEVISVAWGEAASNQVFSIGPGQTVKENISYSSNKPQEAIQLTLKPLHPLTKLTQSQAMIQISTPEIQSSRVTPQMMILGGLSMVTMILAVLSIRKRPHRKKAVALQGKLLHWQLGQDTIESLVLAGRQPMEVFLGQGEHSARHLVSDIEPGFQFTLYPIFSDKNSAVVELRCDPPGLIKKDGEVMTTTILSHGDEFEMGGLYFRYELEQPRKDGKNVLIGRL